MKTEENELLNIFEKILSPDLSKVDGITFKSDSMYVTKIREDNIYGGLRFSVTGFLGNIKDKITIDIGFGDIITPRPLKIEYPVFFNDNPVHLYAYNNESIIA